MFPAVLRRSCWTAPGLLRGSGAGAAGRGGSRSGFALAGLVAAAPTRAVALLAVGGGAVGMIGLAALSLPAQAAPVCTFLMPIGGSGGPVVSKSVGRPKIMPVGMVLGRPNWNTDFVVDRVYSSYRFFFTAISSDAAARYPVQAWMKFSDGSALQVVDETMSPPIGTGRMFGPFPAIAGKQASQMNFKVGTSSDPGATGFSYRISVQGCLGL
ncbi:MAG: hypothetical protein ACKOXO_00535 [Cyanobium sp.]